jgi:RNA-directed DNA polymerase
VDSQLFNSIWQWCCRRHPNKGRRWIKDKYFASIANRNWVFSTTYKNDEGKRNTLSLIKTEHVSIRRHIKIRANATPYDSEYQTYFAERAKRKKISDYKESTYLNSIGNNTTKYTSPKPLGHQKNGFIKA